MDLPSGGPSNMAGHGKWTVSWSVYRWFPMKPTISGGVVWFTQMVAWWMGIGWLVVTGTWLDYWSRNSWELNNRPNWQSHIFQRGETTNQMGIGWLWLNDGWGLDDGGGLDDYDLMGSEFFGAFRTQADNDSNIANAFADNDLLYGLGVSSKLQHGDVNW